MADVSPTIILRTCTRCDTCKPADLAHFAPENRTKIGLQSICRDCSREILRGRKPKDPEYYRKWTERNRGRLREYARMYQRKRRMSPEVKLLDRASSRIRKMVSGKGGRRTDDLLGYSAEELRCHIERQFLSGMSWNNMQKWEVDHIIPIASFSIKTVDCPDFKACWALSNLRPLWRTDNRNKSSKVLVLL